MTTGIRKPGEFCWINMLTPQPAEARAFFGKLLGWTYVEMPGMGYRMQVDGSDIGGLFDLTSPNTPPGTPPLIGVMVKVDSADATGEKVPIARRQGEAGVRHHGPGPHGRLPRSQWRRSSTSGSRRRARAPTSTAPSTAPRAGSRR